MWYPAWFHNTDVSYHLFILWFYVTTNERHCLSENPSDPCSVRDSSQITFSWNNNNSLLDRAETFNAEVEIIPRRESNGKPQVLSWETSLIRVWCILEGFFSRDGSQKTPTLLHFYTCYPIYYYSFRLCILDIVYYEGRRTKLLLTWDSSLDTMLLSLDNSDLRLPRIHSAQDIIAMTIIKNTECAHFTSETAFRYRINDYSTRFGRDNGLSFWFPPVRRTLKVSKRSRTRWRRIR